MWAQQHINLRQNGQQACQCPEISMFLCIVTIDEGTPNDERYEFDAVPLPEGTPCIVIECPEHARYNRDAFEQDHETKCMSGEFGGCHAMNGNAYNGYARSP